MTRVSALSAVLIAVSFPQVAGAQHAALEALAPAIQTRVTCSVQAAKRFAIPANILLAVAEQEGGRVGQWVKNANGSYDVGPMQFNTAYLRELARFEITPQDVEAPGCYPYELAAWRLSRHLHRDRGDIWTRVANYHSRTPDRNARYGAGIRARAAKWGRWLSAHAPTVEIAALDPSTSPAADPPLPSPPPLNTRVATTIVERGKARRSGPVSRPRPRRAEEHHQPATPNPARVVVSANLVDELADFDAQRRAQLLELVGAPNR